MTEERLLTLVINETIHIIFTTQPLYKSLKFKTGLYQARLNLSLN